MTLPDYAAGLDGKETITMFCPMCGAPNEDDAAFCGNCGAALTADERPAEAVAEPTQEVAAEAGPSGPASGETAGEAQPEPSRLEEPEILPPAPPAPPAQPRWTPQPVAASTLPTNGMAIASLLLGIGGLTILPLVGSVLALILGYMAKSEIRRRPDETTGEGLATAGIVMGWIAVGLSVLAVLGIAALSLCGLCGIFGSSTNY